MPRHFHVQLDAFVIMPNHIHGIVAITPGVGGDACVAPTLGTIVGSFKSAVTKRINILRGAAGSAVWQRSYYEHVIRAEHDLNKIREYIEHNPSRWAEDLENPAIGHVGATHASPLPYARW
jgi:REP element-mobilizing transposase RayT